MSDGVITRIPEFRTVLLQSVFAGLVVVVVVVCQRPCEVRAEVGCPTLPTLLGAYVQGRSPPLRQRVNPSSGSQGAGYRNLGHRLVRPRVLVSCAMCIVLSSLITHVCEMMSDSTVPRVGVATRWFTGRARGSCQAVHSRVGKQLGSGVSFKLSVAT